VAVTATLDIVGRSSAIDESVAWTESIMSTEELVVGRSALKAVDISSIADERVL
jgi:hypothetical protein